jgi:hypothetical protein
MQSPPSGRVDLPYLLEGGEVPFGLVTDLATDFLYEIDRG